MNIVYFCKREFYEYLLINIFALISTNEIKKIYLIIEDNNIKNLEKIKEKVKVDIINYHQYISNYINKKNIVSSYDEEAIVKILIPKIIKEDKVLFLDIGALPIADISKLWNTNIDDYYLAAVLEKNISVPLDYIDKFGLNEKNYISSKVMLLNLKKIKKDKIEDKWIDNLYKKNCKFLDQDIINYICQNKILLINNMYNSSSTCGYSEKSRICCSDEIKKTEITQHPFQKIWQCWKKRYYNYLNNDPDDGNIDVIVTAYNAHDYIEKAFNSLIEQTICQRLKVILVNDGSKQGYEDVVSKYSNLIDIKYISYKKNKGIAVARQIGLDNSTSKYITFFDTDDTFYDKHSLERLYNVIKYNTNCKVVIGTTSCEDIEIIHYSHLMNKICRREALKDKNIHFINSRKCHDDVVFSYQVFNKLNEDQIEEVYNITYNYSRDNENSITNSQDKSQALIENIKQIIKLTKKYDTKKHNLLVMMKDLINYDMSYFSSENDRIKYYKLCNKYYNMIKSKIDSTIYNDKDTYQNLIDFIKKISTF